MVANIGGAWLCTFLQAIISLSTVCMAAEHPILCIAHCHLILLRVPSFLFLCGWNLNPCRTSTGPPRALFVNTGIRTERQKYILVTRTVMLKFNLTILCSYLYCNYNVTCYMNKCIGNLYK